MRLWELTLATVPDVRVRANVLNTWMPVVLPARPVPTINKTVFYRVRCRSGLRISEALKLTVADVTRDGLPIRETKFRKTRLVPLHDTAVAGLQRYLARRRPLSETDPVFVDARGLPLRYIAVKETFDRLVGRAGILPVAKRRPRLHDLRHTFAVRALQGIRRIEPKPRAYGGACDLHGSRQHLCDLLVPGGHRRPHARCRRGR